MFFHKMNDFERNIMYFYFHSETTGILHQEYYPKTFSKRNIPIRELFSEFFNTKFGDSRLSKYVPFKKLGTDDENENMMNDVIENLFGQIFVGIDPSDDGI